MTHVVSDEPWLNGWWARLLYQVAEWLRREMHQVPLDVLQNISQTPKGAVASCKLPL